MDSGSGEKHELDANEADLKSDNDALNLTDMSLEFSRNHKKDDLSLAINKVNDLLLISRL